MKASADFRVYQGDGSTIGERGVRLPPVDTGGWTDDPAGYLADEGLRDAVNVAIALGQPLLVTGEPGTGKTQFARSVAYELGLMSPFVFNTKSTSTARDLFYRYDSLRHFHDAQFGNGQKDVEEYIEYESLGLAILRAMPPAAADRFLPAALRVSGPTRSVVLIDEVDKAPRDVPNDVLDEIEQMRFTVRETGRTFTAERSYAPIVILTSNSERTLPDAAHHPAATATGQLVRSCDGRERHPAFREHSGARAAKKTIDGGIARVGADARQSPSRHRPSRPK
jgi:hypothetical protein